MSVNIVHVWADYGELGVISSMKYANSRAFKAFLDLKETTNSDISMAI